MVKRTRDKAAIQLICVWILSVWLILFGCSSEKSGRREEGESLVGGLGRETVAPVRKSGDGALEKERTVSTAGKEVGGVHGVSERVEKVNPSLIYARKFFNYRVRKSRDPFQPLLIEGMPGEGLTLSALTLTGILWDERQSIVVLEDSRGRGYPLRVGDRIAGAKLVAIRKDAAVFRVVEFGEVHSVVKELFVKEEIPI